jgi:hypothetical protein
MKHAREGNDIVPRQLVGIYVLGVSPSIPSSQELLVVLGGPTTQRGFQLQDEIMSCLWQWRRRRFFPDPRSIPAVCKPSDIALEVFVVEGLGRVSEILCPGLLSELVDVVDCDLGRADAIGLEPCMKPAHEVTYVALVVGKDRNVMGRYRGQLMAHSHF